MLHFVLGGARSGKSRFAENLAQLREAEGKQVFYVATATSELKDEQGEISVDLEMQQRIEKHQTDRPSHWQTVETAVNLAQTLNELDDKQHCILVDCLTLWTLNLLQEQCLSEQKQALLDCLPTLSAEVILVSNELGMGVVPLGELSRQFVDELGWLHQEIAELADQVTFMVAGQPMQVKPSPI